MTAWVTSDRDWIIIIPAQQRLESGGNRPTSTKPVHYTGRLLAAKHAPKRPAIARAAAKPDAGHCRRCERRGRPERDVVVQQRD
jgi:hypothetical protein